MAGTIMDRPSTIVFFLLSLLRDLFIATTEEAAYPFSERRSGKTDSQS